MTDFVKTAIFQHTGMITLQRPRALNALSLSMIRALIDVLLAWRDDLAINAVVLRSSADKALCAGGDIRYFYEVGHPLRHSSRAVQCSVTQDCSRWRKTTRSLGLKWLARRSAMYTERCCPPVQPSATVR